jgi:hypothetical protein
VQQVDPVAVISSELAREYGGSVPVGVIVAVAVKAVHDLRGSIASEALPEMAVRLARVRLRGELAAARPAAVGVPA